jgi:S1-C subfamily serine protease
LRARRGGGRLEAMRAALLAFIVACGPKVAPKPVALDEDLGARVGDATADVAPEPSRRDAPPGKGARSGTIERARLVAVLDGGPGAFLRQLEVAPRMTGDRFVGWQLVQLVDRDSALADVDVVPGDVLVAVNGQPVSRPDQLQSLWDSLRTANEIRADLWRGDGKLQLVFAITPSLR